MASYRALRAVNYADPNSNAGILMGFTGLCAEDAAADTNAPPAEIFEMAKLWSEYSSAPSFVDGTLRDLADMIDHNWTNTGAAYQNWLGQLETKRAWAERGTAYANKVSGEGWQGFEEHLAKAEAHLNKAWELDPQDASTPYIVMTVELGQGKGRDVMDKWFQRAMVISTNYYEAALSMSYYLEPRWHGSEEEALEFARGCVQSTRWGGRVPLVLVALHHSLAGYYQLREDPQYWRRPHVWPDVRDSYEKFFKLNPDDLEMRQAHAKDAFLCGHMDAFLAQTTRFGSTTNYTLFGGEPKFRQMLAQAAAAPGSSK